MTAEVAVANKSAVVIAADSAVMASQSIGDKLSTKVFNSANKLFPLTNYHPVGIMFYGATTIGGVPWESVIKEFRRSLGRRSCPTLVAYVDAFRVFLTSCNFLFPDGSQKDIFAYNAWEVLDRLFVGDGQPTTSWVEGALDREISRLRALPAIDGMDAQFQSDLVNSYGREIDDVTDRVTVLGATALPALREKVRTVLKLRFTRQEGLPGFSGIVIAGFEADEVFPSVHEFAVDSVICGRVRWWQASSHSIDERRRGIVVPFANKEVIDIIIRGAHPKVETLYLESALRLLLGVSKSIVSGISEIDESAKAAYIKKASKGVTQAFKDLTLEISEQKRRDIEEPILRTIETLPPTELVNLAEVLLSISQIYQRVTPDVETVAGPIDVAIISKYEGFIWVKRKQFIDAGLNPGFMRQYLDR